jgi:hypothetical protein
VVGRRGAFNSIVPDVAGVAIGEALDDLIVAKLAYT